MKLTEAVRVARKILTEKCNLTHTGKEMLSSANPEEAEAYNLLAQYHEKIAELDKNATLE